MSKQPLTDTHAHTHTPHSSPHTCIFNAFLCFVWHLLRVLS